jgi:hypothetical protein
LIPTEVTKKSYSISDLAILFGPADKPPIHVASKKMLCFDKLEILSTNHKLNECCMK